MKASRYPILLGDETKIRNIAAENQIDMKNCRFIDPRSDAHEEKRNHYAELFFKKRQRKGFNFYESKKIMRDTQPFWLHDGGNRRCGCNDLRPYKKLS